MSERIFRNQSDAIADADTRPAIMNHVWSDFTGVRKPVGRANGYAVFASEHEDGTWGFNGFTYPSYESARNAARRCGY